MNNSDLQFRYHNPVKISFGADIYLDELQKIIGNQSAKIWLFYGRNAMKEIGAIENIKKALSGCQIKEYGNIPPNPDIQDIKIASLNPNRSGMPLCCHWIIAIGGGSVIDFGKSVAFLSRQQHSIEEFLEKSVDNSNPGVPFIAIPTTSGTGSEVTPWATIWDNQQKKKYSLAHEQMFPEYAIIDPQLTLSLPAKVTAYTAFDALSHALEAFWSKFSNPISDLFAIKSISLVMNNLAELMSNLQNLELRSRLAKASLYAGLAFSNTKTTAVHAVSYPMTLYYGIPHGIACSLTLGEFLMFNKNYIKSDKLENLLDVLGYADVNEMKHGLDELAKEVHIPISLKEAGIPKEGIEVILEEGFHPERVTNNPRELTKTKLKNILEGIYE